MLSRRDLLAGGAAAPFAARQSDGDVDALQAEMRTVRDVLIAFQSTNVVATTVVNGLRDRQRVFFRVNQRFPQCIDVGIRVWERMQDWHIAHQRPLTIQVGGDGRFMMDFILSTLVLKNELGDNEIGQAYDRQ
jgi:hypothetical protein